MIPWYWVIVAFLIGCFFSLWTVALLMANEPNKNIQRTKMEE